MHSKQCEYNRHQGLTLMFQPITVAKYGLHSESKSNKAIIIFLASKHVLNTHLYLIKFNKIIFTILKIDFLIFLIEQKESIF